MPGAGRKSKGVRWSEGLEKKVIDARLASRYMAPSSGRPSSARGSETGKSDPNIKVLPAATIYTSQGVNLLLFLRVA